MKAFLLLSVLFTGIQMGMSLPSIQRSICLNDEFHQSLLNDLSHPKSDITKISWKHFYCANEGFNNKSHGENTIVLENSSTLLKAISTIQSIPTLMLDWNDHNYGAHNLPMVPDKMIKTIIPKLFSKPKTIVIGLHIKPNHILKLLGEMKSKGHPIQFPNVESVEYMIETTPTYHTNDLTIQFKTIENNKREWKKFFPNLKTQD
jgi:hypothetical protein